MKQHTIRRKTLAVIAAAAMMLANFALNGSALADTGRANPQSDVTVIAFQQSWNTIAQECQETYGPEGVGYVQISPPMESVQGTQWWTVYQPISYNLNSRFGTREELSNMIKTCAANNVGVIADVVLNHTTGSDVSWVDDQEGVAGTKYNGTYGRYPAMGLYNFAESGNNHQYGYTTGDFHDCTKTIGDYTNANEVQNCRLSSMWDINTGSERVQDIQAAYLADLWNLGVAGFRIDSAKHMNTKDIAGIKKALSQKISVPADEIPFSQEVIAHDGESQEFAPGQYVRNGQVTEFRFAAQLRTAFSGSISGLKNIESGKLPSDKATVFVANWDTERNGESLNPESGAVYELANAFMLGYGYGSPKILSDYYFDDSTTGEAPKGTTATRTPDTDMDKACSTSKTAEKWSWGDWICQPRWTSTRGMVRFHNATAGQKVINWQSKGSNVIAFDRDREGFMAINNQLTDVTATFATSLPDGEYCDVYASRSCSKKLTVSGGAITVKIPARSAVATYVGANKDAEPSGTDEVTPGYNDAVDPSSINDKTLTIYYKPDAKWAGVAYVDYAYANGTYDKVARISMTEVKETTAEGSAPDAEGWYKADLPEGMNTKNVKFRFTDGNESFDYRDNANETSYEANAGTTVIAVNGHQELLGVPFTRTAGGNGTALNSDESQNGGYATSKTTVRLHFAPTEAQKNATGVVIWGLSRTGTTLDKQYVPFDSSLKDGFGQTASVDLDGDYRHVSFRVVASESGDVNATAVDGTKGSYEARTNEDDNTRGTIEVWVKGANGQNDPTYAAPAANDTTPNDQKNPKKITVKIHYYRGDGNYQHFDANTGVWQGWDIYSWNDGGSGTVFTSHDEFGEVATLTYTNTAGVREMPFLLRQGGDAWMDKDPSGSGNRFVPFTAVRVKPGQTEEGTAEIWLVNGDGRIYTHPVATSSVSYDTRGGTAFKAETLPYGGVATKPTEAPKRDGYTFTHWSASEDDSTGKYDFSQPVYGRVKLYAQWRQAHIVNLDTNGGDIPYNPETVDDGGNAIEPEVAPSRTGYTFRYWSTKQDGSSGPYNFDTPVISDLTLYAVWQEKTYTVTFDTGGGSAIETQTVPWGHKAKRPSADPIWSGYTFAGWASDANRTKVHNFDAAVEQNITLYAVWMPESGDLVHTVTYHANYVGDDQDHTVAVFTTTGNAVAAPDPTPVLAGYRLDHWSTDQAGADTYDFSAQVTQNLDLYAQWVKIYTVSFNLNGGTSEPLDDRIIDAGQQVAAPTAPTRSETVDDKTVDYKFLGWATKEESDKAAQKGERARLYDFSTPVKDDVTLVAQWEKSKKWTITFDVNGGVASSKPDDQHIFDGDHIVKPKDPTRDGYTFQGWTTVRNDMLAKSVVSFDEQRNSLMPVDRDGVLYALWSRSTSSASTVFSDVR